jgi:AmiR/NasT family two-component response regulator
LAQDRSKASGQVIDLSQYRYRISRAHLVWYVSQNGAWSDLLSAFKFLLVDEIRSEEELAEKLSVRKPDLILIESTIKWASTVQVIEQLQESLQVPMIMIYDVRSKSSNPALIKRAYAAGCCDTLYTPLQSEDLLESLEVLLKFQKQVSRF